MDAWDGYVASRKRITRGWVDAGVRNPHLRFYNNQRGYVRTRITARSMTADFRVLPYVTTAGAPAHTRATFVIEDRVAGLQQTADVPTPAAALSAGDAARRTTDAGDDTVRQETARP